MALLDCAINKKCCTVDGGRGICPLFSFPPRGICQLNSPHPREFASSIVPTPGNLPAKAKKKLIPGGKPGGAWAQVELTDAWLMIQSSKTSRPAGEIYNNLFAHISLHKDLHTRSTHRMKIILKSRFQFPHWVMKNVLFPKVITILKLIYLLWFKIEQTLPGFGVTRFTSASASAATWLRRCLNSKTHSTARNGKTNRGRPG